MCLSSVDVLFVFRFICIQGVNFWKGLSSSRRDEATQLRLFALQKHARLGPASFAIYQHNAVPTTPAGNQDSNNTSSSGSHHQDGGANSIANDGINNSSSISSSNSNSNTCSGTTAGSAGGGALGVLTEAQMEAWRALGEDLTCDEAKKVFLSEVLALAPYWKYEQFL